MAAKWAKKNRPQWTSERREMQKHQECIMTKVRAGQREVNVAEIKSKYIANIVDAAAKSKGIEKVILFGSSVNGNCTEESDMDLAVFGSLSKTKYLTSGDFKRFYDQLILFDDFRQTYDVLYFNSKAVHDSPIMRQIQEGEVLYEQ